MRCEIAAVRQQLFLGSVLEAHIKVLLTSILLLQHTPLVGQELDLLYTLSIDWNWCLSFGRAISSVGDLDGDSVWDIAVGLEYDVPNEVYLFSGADGHLLDSLYSPNTGHKFGWSLCGVGEPNQEGHRSLLVSARSGSRSPDIFSFT